MTLNTNVKFDKFIVRSSRCQDQISRSLQQQPVGMANNDVEL